jgi:predicted component of type VI protein secretion system
MISLAGDTARKVANLPPPPPGSPDPCRLANRAALERAFREAGFSDFRLEPMTITYEFSEPGEFTQFRYEIAAPFRKMIEGLDAVTRKRALDAVTEEVRRVTGGGVVRLQNETWCVVGRK